MFLYRERDMQSAEVVIVGMALITGSHLRESSVFSGIFNRASLDERRIQQFIGRSGRFSLFAYNRILVTPVPLVNIRQWGGEMAAQCKN